jgi:serine/threonine-protein kinase
MDRTDADETLGPDEPSPRSAGVATELARSPHDTVDVETVASEARPSDGVAETNGGTPTIDALAARPDEIPTVAQAGGDSTQVYAAPGGQCDLETAVGPGADETVAQGAVRGDVTQTRGAASADATWVQAQSRSGRAGEAPSRLAGAQSRYRVLRPHARGGLGEVFVAEDEELRREVALKEIQIRHAHHQESRTRFLIEAEVTGGLEHPGIVPVYGLGQYEDGRPYYAMRFIRGESLRKALDHYHKTEAAHGDAGARELELRQLLGRFIDVCDAIYYSHTRGVLHRDLKPDNIMLGDFGETLVVDWGLAKPLDRVEPTGGATLSQLKPMSASSGSVTMLGSAVGTPQYMSPEQAAGELDKLGPASDIYSLGATLYHVVTGKTPFQERNLYKLLDDVKRGRYTPPRAANPAVPKALEAICLKAMAVAPTDRYPTARALAEDVERWLADEPVSVFREPWTVRARRWAKRHKTLVGTSAALLGTAVAALAVGTILINREKNRTEVQRQMAEGNFALARTAVDEMLSDLGAVELADVPQVEPVRRKMLAKARAFYEEFLREHANDVAVRHGTGLAYMRLGDILEMMSDYDGAQAAYQNAVQTLTPLAQGPRAPAGPRRDLARLYHQRGILNKKSNRLESAEQDLWGAIRLRENLVKESPTHEDYRSDLRDSEYHLAAVVVRLPRRVREGEAGYDKAIEEQKDVIAKARNRPEDRRRLARYMNNLGNLLIRVDWPGAEKVFREALAHQEKLVADAPEVAGYQWELGRTHNNLGRALAEQGRFDDAERQYGLGIDRLKRLADNYPSIPDYRQELTAIQGQLGMLQSRAGRMREAEANLRSAVALVSALRTQFPGRPDYRQRLAQVDYRLGALVVTMKRSLDEADRLYREAIGLLDGLEHSGMNELQNDLGSALGHLGMLLALQRHDPKAALPVLEAAVAHERSALAGDDQNRYYRTAVRNFSMVQFQVLVELRKHAQAVATAEAIAKIPQKPDPTELCRGAQMIAACIPLASGDESLTAAQRRDAGRDYSKRSMDFLRESIRHGFRDLERLKQSEFDPLRNDPEFQKLLNTVETRANPILG